MAQLGDNYSQALDNLEELLEKTPAGSEYDALKAQFDKLWTQSQHLIDSNVQSATQEYNAAVRALSDANRELQAAIAGLKRAADIIHTIAAAVDAVAKLLAKFGII